MSVTTATMPVVLCPVLTSWPGESHQAASHATALDSLDFCWTTSGAPYLIDPPNQQVKGNVLTEPSIADLIHITPTAQTSVAGDPTDSSTSLYVKNLPPDFSELALYQIFSPHGAIFSCRVATDEMGRCKGVGFVNFVHREAALRAMIQLQGHRIGERRHLHLALQAPKAIRKAMRSTASIPSVPTISQTMIWPLSPATASSVTAATAPILQTLSMPGLSFGGQLSLHTP